MSSHKSQRSMQLNISWKSLSTWVFIVAIIASVWAISQTMNTARLDEKDAKIRLLESQIQEMQKEKEQAARPSFGDYEWQWAGENLIGTVSIKKNAEGKDVAIVSMRKFIKNLDIRRQPDGTFEEIDEGFKSQEAMVSTGDGTISGNKSSFKIALPVLRNIFDDQNQYVGDVHQILEADLKPIEAYAGKAQFLQADKSVKKGDMILVRYNSGLHQ